MRLSESRFLHMEVLLMAKAALRKSRIIINKVFDLFAWQLQAIPILVGSPLVHPQLTLSVSLAVFWTSVTCIFNVCYDIYQLVPKMSLKPARSS